MIYENDPSEALIAELKGGGTFAVNGESPGIWILINDDEMVCNSGGLAFSVTYGSAPSPVARTQAVSDPVDLGAVVFDKNHAVKFAVPLWILMFKRRINSLSKWVWANEVALFGGHAYELSPDRKTLTCTTDHGTDVYLDE